MSYSVQYISGSKHRYTLLTFYISASMVTGLVSIFTLNLLAYAVEMFIITGNVATLE